MFLFILFKMFIVIHLQLSAFSPHPSTTPQPNPPPSPTPTLPLDFCSCVLYSSSWKPVSPQAPPSSPLAIVRLFLISMSLVIFWRRSWPTGSALVAVIYKYTRTTEILWRKRGCMAALQVRERARGLERAQERADPHLDRLLLFFWAHYIHRGWSSFTMHRFITGDYLLRTTKDRILLITSKTRMLQLKGETRHTPHLGGLAQTLGS